MTRALVACPLAVILAAPATEPAAVGAVERNFGFSECATVGRNFSSAEPPVAGANVRSQLLGLIIDPWTGDFDGMVQRRRVRLLTPYSKTHYFIDRGAPRGLVFDYGMKLEQEINRLLKTTAATKVHVVFVPTPRERLFQSLNEGLGDVIASNLAVTRERAKDVDFTIHGHTVTQVIVSGPVAKRISTVDDLAGVQIGAREGSAELDNLLALNARLMSRGQRSIVVRPLPRNLEDEDLLEMVNAGLLDATVVADVIAAFWGAVLPKLRLHSNIIVREGVAIAWAVRKNSPQLLAVLNPIVDANKVGTRFGNATLQTYLRTARFVTPATAPAKIATFAALRDTFQRYANRYQLDYLLMMAQGYQESGLSQAVRSRKGAIGIMQVMPATGQELKVGDIHQVEANVHAGVKYVRLIIDRYFAREPMSVLDQTLFALAAYNCGPTCVARLRTEATRRGLNPNVWFGHVEGIAGEQVGRQTVDYVSNIYKYYVAYKLQEMASK